MAFDGRAFQSQTVEGFEQLGLLFERQPRAEVDHLDAHPMVGPCRLQQHPAAGRAILHRIAGQISDHLGQTLRVRLGDQGVALDQDFDRKALGLRLQDQSASDVLQQARHVGRPQLDLDRPGFGARHVQQIMRQSLDLTGGLDQHLRHLDLVRRGRAELAAGPELAYADDAADRALDLMGDVGQQPRLGR